MGGSKEKDEAGAALQVDATASGSRGSLNEFDSIPQTTCFGFRRKRTQKARSARLSQDMANSTPEMAASRSDKVSKDKLCGAGAFLSTFSSTGDLTSTETSTSLQKASDKLERAKETSQTAKILASYDNLPGASRQAGGTEEEERDGNREDDGADSLEDEDTFDVPPWIVDPHDIYFISRCDGTGKVCRLGKGDFGPVYMGVWKDREVAVKLARQKPISLKQERHFQLQAAKLFRLDHPNVVRFLGACCWKGGKRSVIVMEYMEKSDLRSLLARDELIAKFAWVQHGRAVGLDIAKGLAYLHSQGIVHGRLKSSNVLMNKAGVAKLSDPHLLSLLSHCRDLNADRSAPIGSRCPAHGPHVAPEVHSGGEPSRQADVYALGVILWELLTLERPDGILRPIRTPEEAPAKIAYVIECCLAKEPLARPTVDRIVAVLAGRS